MIGSNTLIQLFYYFCIYGFLGWLMESSIFTYKAKHFISRGFLKGPICPIYGVGMVLVIIGLTPFKSSILMVFVLGGIIASTIEYVTGYLLELCFNTRWWDYSKDRFNLNGYICALNSFYWCALATIMIYVVQPIIASIVALIPLTLYYKIAGFLMGWLVIDSITTVAGLVKLRVHLKTMSGVKDKIVNHLKQDRAFDTLINHFETANRSFDQLLNDVKTDLNDRKPSDEFINVFTDLQAEYQKMVAHQTGVQSRLMKAYPKAFSKKFNHAMKSLLDYNKQK